MGVFGEEKGWIQTDDADLVALTDALRSAMSNLS